MKWSSQQQAIFNYILYQTASLVALARAGTGKTTTMVEAARRVLDERPQTRVAAMAFNKEAQLALQAKMPAKVDTKTFNAFGFHAVIRAWGKVRVDSRHEGDLLHQIDRQIRGELRSAVLDLVDWCKNTLSEPSEETAWKCGGIASVVNGQLEWVLWLAATVLSESRQQHSTISFTDQIWLPLRARALRPAVRPGHGRRGARSERGADRSGSQGGCSRRPARRGG